MPVMEGLGLGTPLQNAGAPSAGTNEVQTLTIGGTPTGGTFRLSASGFSTAAITWSNVNATLIAAIDAALEALPVIGAGNVVTAAGTLTAGIGTVTLTFGGALAGVPAPQVGVADNSLTGTTPTLAVARTTPGVAATGRGAPRGARLIDTSTGVQYTNTSATATPTWVTIGSQT